MKSKNFIKKTNLFSDLENGQDGHVGAHFLGKKNLLSELAFMVTYALMNKIYSGSQK